VYRYAAGKVDWVSNGLPSEGELASEPRIGAIARRQVATCRLGQRIGEIAAQDGLCVVVNEAGVVLGDLRGEALRADPRTPVEAVMNPGPSTYRPNLGIKRMAHHLLESGARRVLVTDADGHLIGWLTREDVERALEEHRHAEVAAE
jgi:Mg/Co/Ni transporter MgtE